MTQKRILHMFAPGDNVSPFDVNMGIDAGYDVAIPYTGVSEDRVRAFVQDAIFSRPPKSFASTAAFIGGYDVNMAADMFDQARQAMVPPFEISVFSDPNGAYTTAAATVALVEHWLKVRTGEGLQGRNAMILGGGPVGLCTGVLVARRGGAATLVRLTHRAADEAATRFADRYSVTLGAVDGQTEAQKADALRDADVVIACAKAGIQVVGRALLDSASRLVVAADVNAVPPAGIEGVGVMDNGSEIQTAAGTVTGIGALGIGKIKYDVQHGLFERMIEADKAVFLDFVDAYELAAQHV